MSLLRLLNVQGIAGLAIGIALTILLVIQKGETRHWKEQSAHFEQLYGKQQTALAATVANYRAATEQAGAADRANAERVAAEQRSINERTSNDYEARLAAARTLAQRLRGESAGDAADRGGSGSSAVPHLSGSALGPAESPREDRLSQSDRLTATEQAIQLDELIKWVRRQSEVEPNGAQR